MFQPFDVIRFIMEDPSMFSDKPIEGYYISKNFTIYSEELPLSISELFRPLLVHITRTKDGVGVLKKYALLFVDAMILSDYISERKPPSIQKIQIMDRNMNIWFEYDKPRGGGTIYKKNNRFF